MPTLILASTSPYRRELLARLRLPFTVESPGVDEERFKRPDLAPCEIVEALAMEKARAVLARHPGATVIGSDQLLALGSQVLGKPGNAGNALAQLKSLSGRSHELLTAVAVVRGHETRRHLDRTRLEMEPLDEPALRRYVENDQPLDCAGSYKIESQGIALFRRIEGEDMTAIQGLPLLALSRILRELGFVLP